MIDLIVSVGLGLASSWAAAPGASPESARVASVQSEEPTQPESGVQESGAPEPVRLAGWWRVSGEAPPTAAEVARELAGIEVDMTVSRDFPSATKRVMKLWQAASTKQEFEGQTEALIEVAALRAKLLLGCGERGSAHDHASRLWPQSRDLVAFGLGKSREGLALIDEAARAREERALLAPRLVALRAQARPQQVMGQGADAPLRDSSAEERLYETLRNGVMQGTALALAYELRGAAVEALERLSLESLGDILMSSERDPLAVLIAADEDAASLFVAQHIEDGGFLWKKRIARAMNRGRVLENQGTFSELGGICLQPGWLVALDTLCADPELAADAFGLVRQCLEWDFLTEASREFLRAQLADPKSTRAGLWQELHYVKDRECLRPVYDGLIESPDGRVVLYIADGLASMSDVGTLRTLVRHPDPRVRSKLAASFRSDYPWEGPSFESSHGQQRVSLRVPTLRDGDLELLMELLGDPDPAVSSEALKSVLEGPLHELALPALLAGWDGWSSVVKERLVWVSDADVERLVEFVRRAARDTDPAVRSAAAERAWTLEVPAAEILPIVRELYENQSLSSDELNVSLQRFCGDALGARALAGWILSTDDPQLRVMGFGALRNRWSDMVLLPPAQFMALVRSAQGVVDLPGDLGSLSFDTNQLSRAMHALYMGGDRQERMTPAELLIAVAEDKRSSIDNRAWALYSLSQRGWSEDLGLLMTSVMRDPRWEALDELGGRGGAKDAMDESYSVLVKNPQREDFALELLSDTQIPEPLARYCMQRYLNIRSRSVGFDLASGVLQRWGVGPQSLDGAGALIERLGDFPERCDRAYLEQLALGSEYPDMAVNAIAKLGDASLYPTLARCLRAEWIEDTQEAHRLRMAAVRALAKARDNVAAGYLLEALDQARNDQLRAQILSSLQQIREHQEEKEIWQRRLAAANVQREAVQALRAMLAEGDALAQVEAMRALASLGDVESLPRVVERLRSEEPAVREAAQEAIRVLGRAPEPVGRRAESQAPAEQEAEGGE